MYIYDINTLSLTLTDLTSSGRTYDLADRRAYDSQGYDSAGFDRLGYNRQGYNGDGYDKNGYDIQGSVFFLSSPTNMYIYGHL